MSLKGVPTGISLLGFDLICALLSREDSSVAVAWFSGLQFYHYSVPVTVVMKNMVWCEFAGILVKHHKPGSGGMALIVSLLPGRRGRHGF